MEPDCGWPERGISTQSAGIALFNMEASNHIWILSTWNVTEELDLYFKILINLSLDSHLWLVATIIRQCTFTRRNLHSTLRSQDAASPWAESGSVHMLEGYTCLVDITFPHPLFWFLSGQPALVKWWVPGGRGPNDLVLTFASSGPPTMLRAQSSLTQMESG